MPFHYREDAQRDGTVLAISWHTHKLGFWIYDYPEGPGIRCECPQQEELLKKLIPLFRRRIRVRGIARINHWNDVVSIMVASFEGLPEPPSQPEPAATDEGDADGPLTAEEAPLAAWEDTHA